MKHGVPENLSPGWGLHEPRFLLYEDVSSSTLCTKEVALGRLTATQIGRGLRVEMKDER